MNVVKNHAITRISIDESGVHLPHIERIVNDVIVQSTKVNPTTLHELFIDIADDYMVYQKFAKSDINGYSFPKLFFEYMNTHELDDDEFFESWLVALFEFLEKNNGSSETLLKVLRIIVTNADLSQLSNEMYSKVLGGLIRNIDEHVKDPKEILGLMELLLSKSRFFEEPGEELLLRMSAAFVKHYGVMSNPEQIQNLMSILWSKLPESAQVDYITSVANKKYYESDLLPKGTVFIQEVNDKTRIVVFVEAHRRLVNLLGTTYEDVGHPNMLFLYDIDKKGNVNVGLFALKAKDSRLTEETPVYRYPFSNVFKEGRCCWSGYPQIKKWSQLDSFPDMFLSNERNMDLYPKPKEVEYRDLLMRLRGKDFDESYLLETELKLRDLRIRR